MNLQVTVYLTVGIPGSGKTTWTEKNFNKSVVRIALDEIRREVYGYFPQELDDQKERTTWEKALNIAAENILKGKDVLIDSMALTKGFRRRLISDIENRTGITFKKVAIFLDTPVEIAIRRNNGRSKQVLETTIRKLSSFLEPPEAAKEFDEVIRVDTKERIDDSLVHVTMEWKS